MTPHRQRNTASPSSRASAIALVAVLAGAALCGVSYSLWFGSGREEKASLAAKEDDGTEPASRAAEDPPRSREERRHEGVKKQAESRAPEAPSPLDAFRNGWAPSPLPLKFDPSCDALAPSLRGSKDLDSLVTLASGMKGTSFLPEAERVVQFHYGWSDAGAAYDLGLARTGDAPAFFDVTFVRDATTPGAKNEAAAFTGANRTTTLSLARERIESLLMNATSDAKSGVRHLQLERVTPTAQGIETRNAKFEGASAVSYTQPGLSCARTEGRKEAACFCGAL